MKSLIVLSVLLAAGLSLDLEGQCQPVEVVQDFDIPKYGGLWHEIYRYDNEYEPDGDCVTARYTLNEWGNVTVLNSMVVANNLFTIEGTAAPAADANGSAKLVVWFPSDQADNIFFNYWVLSTDYDNYALVYACTNLPNNMKRVSSWILSRTNYLKPESVIAMNPALQAADGLDWDTFSYTDHTESVCATSRH